MTAIMTPPARPDAGTAGATSSPRTDHRLPSEGVRRVLRPLLGVWARNRVLGAEHLPSEGAFIVASTHASHADAPIVGLASPRPLLFLGDERLTRAPLLGPILPKLGMVSVRRGTADQDALDTLLAALDDGQPIVIFPEGGRTRDGRVYRPRGGVARLAAAAGVPVVPVGLEGSRRLWPVEGRPRLLGGRVTVRFGPPIPPPDDRPAARRRFVLDLHHELASLARAELADEYLYSYATKDVA